MNWNHIRIFGNSAPARAAIIMPFVGYLIFLNEHIQNILRSKFPGAEELISIQGLYYFYVGAVFVGIGSLIYYAKCPEPIRVFSNDRDFISAYIESMNPMKLTDVFSEMKVDSSGLNGKILAIRSLHEAGDVDIGKTNTSFVLYCYYIFLLKKGIYWIYTCGFMYSVGIIMIITPTVFSVFKVLAIIVGHYY